MALGRSGGDVRFRPILCWSALFLWSIRLWGATPCNKGGFARSTVINDAGDAIDFALDHPVSYTDEDRSVQWLIYDQDARASVPIKAVHYDKPPQSSTGRITLGEPLSSTHTYILSAVGLKFENCSETVQTNFVRV